MTIEQRIVAKLKELHGRAPCGARGLKFEITYMGEKKSLSRPMRSVWAEIRPRRTI